MVSLNEKTRRQTAFYLNMNSSNKSQSLSIIYQKLITDLLGNKPFSCSVAKREPVMTSSSGNIEHLQHYFTKIEIAAKNGWDLKSAFSMCHYIYTRRKFHWTNLTVDWPAIGGRTHIRRARYRITPISSYTSGYTMTNVSTEREDFRGNPTPSCEV